MSASIQLLEQAITEEPSRRSIYRWEDLLAAIEMLAESNPLGWEAERVLLRVLRFDGSLRLTEDSEPPHSMSPEEMLKSVAIQALAKWTNLNHLLEMQRVEATASSPVLASIVRATIRAAASPKLPVSRIEIIKEMRPSARRVLIRGPRSRRIGARSPMMLPQHGMPNASANKAVVPNLYTKYDVPCTPPQKQNFVTKALILEHGLTYMTGRRGRKRRAEEVPAFA